MMCTQRLAAAHVYVLRSYREGTHATVLRKRWLTGRAIITTDATGCRETVRDGGGMRFLYRFVMLRRLLLLLEKFLLEALN